MRVYGRWAIGTNTRLRLNVMLSSAFHGFAQRSELCQAVYMYAQYWLRRRIALHGVSAALPSRSCDSEMPAIDTGSSTYRAPALRLTLSLRLLSSIRRRGRKTLVGQELVELRVLTSSSMLYDPAEAAAVRWIEAASCPTCAASRVVTQYTRRYEVCSYSHRRPRESQVPL